LFAHDNTEDLDQSAKTKRSNLKCEPWYIKYTHYNETNPLRHDIDLPVIEVRQQLKGSSDDVNISAKGKGTRTMFYYEAVGTGCQLLYRKHGCSCIRCVQNLELQPANVRPRIPETLLPSSDNCDLEEPWLYQHCNMVKKPNPKHKAVIDGKKEKKDKRDALKKEQKKEADDTLVMEGEDLDAGLSTDLLVLAGVAAADLHHGGRVHYDNTATYPCSCSMVCGETFPLNCLHRCNQVGCSTLIYRDHSQRFWRCHLHNYPWNLHLRCKD
jgi:hypothetical protein